MKTPIELHFYNRNNEIIKTWSQDRITWEFFKKATKFENINIADTAGVDILATFVCDFYGNRFSKRKLLKHTDVEQLIAVAGAIVMRTIGIMKDNGVELPNAAPAPKR